MSVCFCRDRCTSIGRVKVLKSTTGYAETRCRCMYASPPRYRCIREEGHERMHSGSRFDRPSTPARPFTGAPDKLAERRWGKKRINQEGEENESRFGCVCIIGKPFWFIWITFRHGGQLSKGFLIFSPLEFLTRKIYRWIRKIICSLGDFEDLE